ncbi:MAG TPA: hypothetical protein ENJ37_02515 [Deltaproteobacteria bacterium]|nr:hypothetical protein [Deltaproteobacteria bacterium]
MGDESTEKSREGQGPPRPPLPKRPAPLRRLYLKLASLRTSVYILGVMCLFYLLGTVFPQGAEVEAYIEAQGRFARAVELFDLLNVFKTPWFIALSMVLLANLCVCSYERLTALLSRKRPTAQDYAPTHDLALTHECDEAQEAVRGVLRGELGFRTIAQGKEWTVVEKGLSYRWLTWLYHAGIVACFVGFIVTGVAAYEDMITLKPGEPEYVEPAGFSLMLDEFITEYTHFPDLDYPEKSDKRSRLAIGLGWKAPTYSVDEDSLFPKDWKSRLKVLKDNVAVLEKTIEVNDPLVYRGFTFYQMAFEQYVKVWVDGGPVSLTAKVGDELIVPGLEGTLRFKGLRTGTLYRLDGKTEEIKPFVSVSYVEDGEGGEREVRDLGRLRLGESLWVGGKKITFIDFTEDSVLSYRYDPGVPILWWSGIFVLVAMTLRCFGGWYLVAYRIEEADGITYLTLSISTKGLGADADSMAARIEHYLRRSELRPTPLELV